MQRCVDAPRFQRVAPMPGEGGLESFNRSRSICCNVLTCRRPRHHITNELRQRELARKCEARHLEFIEWKWNGRVPVENKPALGMPVALDRSTIELMENLLKLRRIED